MATNFPTSLDSFSDPAATDATNAGIGHHAQHGNANDAIAALEAKVGINSSAVTTSLDYLVAKRALLQEGVNTVTNSGSTQTIPDVTTATINVITLTANCTFTFPTAAAGKSFVLQLIQDGTANRTVTWPGSVKWPGGNAPTLSTTANYQDLTSFLSTDGSTWLGNLAGLGYR